MSMYTIGFYSVLQSVCSAKVLKILFILKLKCSSFMIQNEIQMKLKIRSLWDIYYRTIAFIILFFIILIFYYISFFSPSNSYIFQKQEKKDESDLLLKKASSSQWT